LEHQKYFYIDRLLRKHTKRAENCGVQGFNKTLFFIYGEKSLMLMPLKKAFENNGFIKNSALHYKIINQRSDLITAIVVSTIGELQNGYYPIKTEDVLSDIEIIDFILQFKGEQQPGTESLEAKYIETIKRCANDNLPDAVFLLGYCYFSGKGIPVNLELALKLIKKAAKNGSLPAIEFLSSLGLDENE
jgi:TPR repeat protein